MQITKTISLSAALLVSAVSAMAHDGEHAQSTFAAVVAHYTTHPDHLVPLALALILAVVAMAKPAIVTRVWRALTRRAPK